MLHYKRSDTATFTVKTSWEEVTVKEYISLMLMTDDDVFSLLEILTSLERYDLNRIALHHNSLEHLLDAVDWFRELPDFAKLPMPETLTIKEKTVKLPKDIRQELFGQVKLLQQRVNECKEREQDISTLVADAIGIFVHKQYTGKDLDSEEELEAIKQDIYDIPIMTAYPVGAFFLTNCMRLSKKRMQPLKDSNLSRKKRQQV